MIRGLRHRTIASRMLGLLMQERAALLAGRLNEIGAHAGAIADLCDALDALPPTRDAHFHAQLAKIQALAARNQILADSCARGVRKVSRLQEEAATARWRLGTYTNTGVRRDFVLGAATRDRRT